MSKATDKFYREEFPQLVVTIGIRAAILKREALRAAGLI